MKLKTCIGLLLWFGLLAVIAGAAQVPLRSEKYVEVPFLNAEMSRHALVFFGFTECHGVCPTTMLSLRNFYLSQNSTNDLPSVVFVDIDRDSDLTQAQQYAEQFHESFGAYFPSSQELKRVKDEFGLNIRTKDDEIRHRGYLYYMAREEKGWKLIKAFPPQRVTTEFLEREIM